MDFQAVIKSRRAIGFFDETRPVSDELIKRMINLAAMTPSSFNLQPWNLVVLTDKEDKLRLQACAMNQPRVSQAPVTMIVLADRDGYLSTSSTVERVFKENIKAGIMTPDQRDWFEKARNNLYGKSEQSVQAFACKNAGFFAMALMLSAKALGLDTHPMDGFDHEAVVREFNIPENYYIPLLISVGYADRQHDLPAPKWRKSVEDIVVSFDR